jgi:aconitase A
MSAQEKEQSVIWVPKLAQRLHFGYDASSEEYLRSTDRADVADADKIASYLTGDAAVYENPELYFDQVIEINLDELEPHLNGPLRQIWQRQFQK